MADKIQLTLESLVPEMDILVQKGYFEKKDVKKIMKKRRYHEYQFEKTDVLPLDYFRAIKYEKILNKRMKLKKKNINIKKNDYYDFHFIRRIIALYKKCLIKFNKNNDDIWMEYLNFLLVNKCNNILNKEIGRCLTLHPTNIIFWKIAAYHEYEDNLNFNNARNLFQKCIKLNSNNIDAYIEYFCFELIFAENLTQRRNILSGKDKKDNKLKILDDVIKNDDNLMKEEDDKNKINEDNNNENNDICNLKIPEIIYEDAISKLKRNNIKEILDIHFQFLEKLEEYGTSKNLKYENIENKIITNIEEIIKNNKGDSESFIIENDIKIILTKSKKYNPETLLEKIKLISKEFNDNLYITKNKKYFNLISYYYLSYFLNDEKNDNEEYFDELINNVKSKISTKNLNDVAFLDFNLKLLVVITSKNYLIQKLLLENNNYDISKNIFELFKIVLQQNNIDFLQNIFLIFTNIKDLLINDDSENSFVNTITKFNFNCNNSDDDDNYFNFLNTYIDLLIKYISHDVTYYLNPDLMKEFFTMINKQFVRNKVNYVILKELYSKMIQLILEKCCEINDNYENEDGQNYYNEAFLFVKDNIKKNLISFIDIKNEIFKKVSKERSENKKNLDFLKWIN